jgi:acetoin utilization deacetylase AcuC-like enzyme
MGDLACPVGEHTFMAACRAADTAVAAARAVADGAASAYALCRPPGHHASREVAAGHCFLNNAAIAAEDLARRGARPAVLDIDVHHGNGTQAIFYERGDVLVVSVHADPHHFYPWFVGHGHEAGAGAGEGANVNLPLPIGAQDELWLQAVRAGLSEAARFGADVVILSLGLDVHVSDPLAGMAVTTAGIRRAGEIIADAGRPVVIVQEGGYLTKTLTDNLAAFLEGFLGGRPGGGASP